MKDIEKDEVKKKEEKVEVKKDVEIKTDEVQSFENGNRLKDYRFTIILLAVIALAAFGMPFISKSFKELAESNFLDNLFSKNNTQEQTTDKTHNKEENNNSVIINSDKSGANEPVLKEGMIPVRYNMIQKKWVKADSTNPSTNNWYNYNNSEWANAILVRQNGTKSREYYEKASPDTIINDEDILAFFVWIPRYKYSIVSSMGVQQIDVVFEEKNAVKTTGPNYITHSAFTFDGEELAGIWVGKFEVTGSMYNITVLPNYSAIVNQNISTMFNGIQGLYSSAYGLNQDDSNLRLIKNTEWGAAVYLSNSKYGLCKNNTCTSMTSYISDYSSDIGITASTTGNITGIYAMNGSVMEYVMGNNNGLCGQSGFDSGWMNENKKYFDLYKDGSITDFTRGIYGDATTEFGPFNDNLSSWNDSYSKFVDADNPWFFRDINNSMYSFSSYNGDAHPQLGFRLSLS